MMSGNLFDQFSQHEMGAVLFLIQVQYFFCTDGNNLGTYSLGLLFCLELLISPVVSSVRHCCVVAQAVEVTPVVVLLGVSSSSSVLS